MNELALFAGSGGGILGGQMLGWETVCAVEIEPYPASVLVARQNDGLLPPFPIWDDVCTFDGRPWRGIVDVVSGGFPCQDISSAGAGAGITGERSGLWKEFARIICEVRPRFAFVENSPMLTVRGLDVVLGDLASMGYDARWGVLGARDVGAPHKRDRIWIVAHARGVRCHPGGARQPLQGTWVDGPPSVANTTDNGPPDQQLTTVISEQEFTTVGGGGGNMANTNNTELGNATSEGFQVRSSVKMGESSKIAEPERSGCNNLGNAMCIGLEGAGAELAAAGTVRASEVADANGPQCERDKRTERSQEERANTSVEGWWKTEPDVGRVVDGMAARVDRLKAIGNGQVPQCAAEAWRILTNEL
jgi:DNA (cytosine-5)-methyltransferase 1